MAYNIYIEGDKIIHIGVIGEDVRCSKPEDICKWVLHNGEEVNLPIPTNEEIVHAIKNQIESIGYRS